MTKNMEKEFMYILMERKKVSGMKEISLVGLKKAGDRGFCPL